MYYIHIYTIYLSIILIISMILYLQVILDGNFIHQALKYKLDIKERLGKLLQEEEVKIFIQKSVIDELKAVGAKTKVSLEFAEKFCAIVDDKNIPGETPSDRLVHMLGNNINCNYMNSNNINSNNINSNNINSDIINCNNINSNNINNNIF